MTVLNGPASRHPDEFHEMMRGMLGLIEQIADNKKLVCGFGQTTITITWKAGKPNTIELSDSGMVRFSESVPK
jgi:hypothetical protein